MKTKHTSLTKKIMPGLIIILTLIILVGMLGISPVGTHPDITYKAVGVEPNPSLNVNATWATYYHDYKGLEYFNGTSNQTIHAGYSQFYKNPITVNPTDIITSELQGKIAGIQWQNPASYTDNGVSNSSIITQSISNTSTSLTLTSTTTGAASGNSLIRMQPQFANFPSANLQYDYLTMIVKTTSTISITNPSEIYIHSSTGGLPSIHGEIQGGIAKGTTNTTYISGIEYYSLNLAKLQLNGNPQTDIDIKQFLPAEADTITTTIYGMALTTAPITLGEAVNGQGMNYTPTGSVGDIHLTTFAPNFVYSAVANNGYTVALSQSLQNVSISQSSINDGSFIEETTTQGVLQLPNAPDLTYGNANISMKIALPGEQYKVFNINGQSFTPAISTMKNGTFAQEGINPNNANSVIVEAYYTSSEWDSVSSPPSFWTNPIASIEYYWYVALGAALGIIGLGAGIKSRSNSVRTPKR